MSVTDNERREVAARLRELTKRYGIHSDEQFCELFDKTLDNPRGFHTYVSNLFYLADLIEPEPVSVANITFTKEQQEELFQRAMEELRVNVNLAEAVDAICGQMCGDGWDWRMRAETVVKTIAEMCGAKVVE